MGRKWPSKSMYDGSGPVSKTSRRSALHNCYLIEQLSVGTYMHTYSIFDTIICSYSRFEEFRRLMDEKPIDERSKVIANIGICHNMVFYVDSYGRASKYMIEEPDEVDNA